MRVVRSAVLLSLLALTVASSAGAQVSCANPDNLCTGDPCTISSNIEVISPCTVDFGARALVIAGILSIPDGGSMSLTAASILQQGPIDGRHVGNGVGTGAAVTLIANAGDVELRGEIDVAGTVATGSINVQASGDVLVEDTLIAKPAGSNITAIGGNVAIDAVGTVTTDQSALIDVQAAAGSGGVVFIDGDAGVLIEGRVHAEGNPGGSIVIGSSLATVTLERDLRVQSADGPGGLIIVNGETGVAVNDKILASSDVTVGGSVQLTSPNGDVVIDDAVNAGGVIGGSVSISALNGTVAPTVRIDVRSSTGTGGTIGIDADTITLRKDLEARSRSGNGGQITLNATTLLDLVGGDAEAGGRIDGGSISLQSSAGNVQVGRSSSLTASGSRGNGGSLVIAAPAGAVTLETKVALTGNGPLGAGGQSQIDGAAITITRARIDADGRATGGELCFNQSGAGLFLLDGSFEARDDGTIEALAPAGNLTVRGKLRAQSVGCIGLSAGGTLDTTAANTDVPITPTCP